MNAVTREVSGKQVKKLRAQGLVPAVVYGHGVEARNITVDGREFEKIFKQAGESTLVDLSVDGRTSVKALIQDVQFEPFKGGFVHVDFRQVRMDEKLEAEIPLKFVGEAPAVRELGATLVRALDTVTVLCLPQYLVHEIEVPLDSLKAVDDSITVADLKVPEGLEITDEPDQIIAVVNAAITEEEIKAMEEATTADVSAVKSAADEKKAEKEATGTTEEPAKAAK